MGKSHKKVWHPETEAELEQRRKNRASFLKFAPTRWAERMTGRPKEREFREQCAPAKEVSIVPSTPPLPSTPSASAPPAIREPLS